MDLRDGLLVVSMDPGKRTAFVAIEVPVVNNLIQVIAWGKVTISVKPGFDPQSILQNPWEASCVIEGPTSLSELAALYFKKPQLVWEQQRGYLELCVGAPFVQSLNQNPDGSGVPKTKIDKIPPNEKFFRLGVGKNKEQSVSYAVAFLKDKCPALVEYFTNHPVDEVHDVADACLLAIMWLEEHFSMPILKSQPCPLPSGCPVSKALALTYAKVNVNSRKGANITRRIAVTARIAASHATFLSLILEGSRPRRLTRKFLRRLEMPTSEAADLCWFATWVVNILVPPFVGVALNLEGLSFSIYKVKGNKRSAAAALANDSLDALKAIMVY